LEKIWRRHAYVVRDDLSPIVRFVIRDIVVILVVKRPGRGNGRRRSWPATRIIERIRPKPRGSGGGGTRITGRSIGRRIPPTRREIV
jgi:hypothetical protein